LFDQSMHGLYSSKLGSGLQWTRWWSTSHISKTLFSTTDYTARQDQVMDKLEETLREEDKAIDDLETMLAEKRQNKIKLLAEQQRVSGKIGFVANVQRKLQTTTTLLQLLKWNTPTVYNGWEQVTKNPNYGRECFNLEPIQDHSPEMGPMVGYAVTVKIHPGDVGIVEKYGASGRKGMWSFMASLPTEIPKIVVVEDLAKPAIYGSMWGEVNATFFKSVGALGCITDGGVRDLDEMKNVGFHAMSRGVTISHSYGVPPIEWDVPVSAFGVTVRPGQLIHADKHGFLVVPEEDEENLLEATEFMDLMERKYVITPGREGSGSHPLQIAKKMGEVFTEMSKEKKEKYGTFRSRFPEFKQ